MVGQGPLLAGPRLGLMPGVLLQVGEVTRPEPAPLDIGSQDDGVHLANPTTAFDPAGELPAVDKPTYRIDAHAQPLGDLRQREPPVVTRHPTECSDRLDEHDPRQVERHRNREGSRDAPLFGPPVVDLCR